MSRYSEQTDRKWQQRWDESGIYRFNPERADKKLYCLEMFSYPSAATLHIGHWWNYGMTDCWTRMHRMQDYEVFHPVGFDAFGLPAENYAIRTGIHPQDSTLGNIATMQQQLRRIGATFDWSYELSTCDPEYYRWTQWLFLKLYEKGLAYRKEAPVNWCPSCQTVLANEQVHDGNCERCGSVVTRRNLTQWFFRITAYAEELVNAIDGLDWPEKTKAMQKNWIGRSEGAFIEFALEQHDGSIRVFTTRADTLYGATYVVLAPEHALVDVVTTPEQKEAIQDYQKLTSAQSELDRLTSAKEKTGVFTGAYAIHPLTGARLPIWIADYVLASYGTGSVMAVPGHDTRDFDFATIYNLPIPCVIVPSDGGEAELPYTDDGILVNSAEFDGQTSEAARAGIVACLHEHGERAITYRLRDWLISRQRYWGAPIPIIHCPHCGEVPVPEDQLPVELPYDVEFTPDGKSPLAKSDAFMHTTCPRCGADALRDPDTLDTFVDSSWYFLRFPCSHYENQAFDTEWVNRMLPVDKYVGGPEHACMHLLYARFIVKALRDMGYLSFDEPFTSLFHQGIILGADGQKMSKSKNNSVSPDGYVQKYGSDVLRLYMGFGFSYAEGGPWDTYTPDTPEEKRDSGIKSQARFVERIERWIDRIIALGTKSIPENTDGIKVLNQARHAAIRAVTRDLPEYQFNTSIAQIMTLMNALNRYDQDIAAKNPAFLHEVTEDMLRLLAPMAPHLCEELWEQLGHKTSIHNETWPTWDEAALILDETEYAVQINGKIRAKFTIASDASDDDVQNMALSQAAIANELEGKQISKIVVVQRRLVNIVAR